MEYAITDGGGSRVTPDALPWYEECHRLRRLVLGLADRVHAQSELLSRRAERKMEKTENAGEVPAALQALGGPGGVYKLPTTGKEVDWRLTGWHFGDGGAEPYYEFEAVGQPGRTAMMSASRFRRWLGSETGYDKVAAPPAGPAAAAQPPPAETQSTRLHEGRKYLRVVHSATHDAAVEADVYEVLDAFLPPGLPGRDAVAHAAKKLLCAGARGKGSVLEDLVGAQAALARAIDFARRPEGWRDGGGPEDPAPPADSEGGEE